MSQETNAEKKECTGRFIITPKGWEFQPEPGTDCQKALETLKELGPAARTYVSKHISPSDTE